MEVVCAIATMAEDREAAKYSTMGESHSQQRSMQYQMPRGAEEPNIKGEVSRLWHLKVGCRSCVSG